MDDIKLNERPERRRSPDGESWQERYARAKREALEEYARAYGITPVGDECSDAIDYIAAGHTLEEAEAWAAERTRAALAALSKGATEHEQQMQRDG